MVTAIAIEVRSITAMPTRPLHRSALVVRRVGASRYEIITSKSGVGIYSIIDPIYTTVSRSLFK
jgi:hypothetical protein